MSFQQAPASKHITAPEHSCKGQTTCPATRQAKQRAMLTIRHMTSTPSIAGLHSSPLNSCCGKPPQSDISQAQPMTRTTYDAVLSATSALLCGPFGRETGHTRKFT